MNTEKQPKALADHIADASKMAAPSNLKQLADSFPELNMSNYGAEDVDALHNWSLEVVQAITAIDHAAAPVVWPEPVGRVTTSPHGLFFAYDNVITATPKALYTRAQVEAMLEAQVVKP